jgi:uncharacterized protein (DUF1697 family)
MSVCEPTQCLARRGGRLCDITEAYSAGLRVVLVAPSSALRKILSRAPFWSVLIDDVRIYNKALSTDEIASLAQYVNLLKGY